MASRIFVPIALLSLLLFLLQTSSAEALNISLIYCTPEDGCGTDDGWQVKCPSHQPLQKGTTKLLKSFSINDFYIIVNSMTIPQQSLDLAISPENSPVQTIPPNATAPPMPPFIPDSLVLDDPYLARLSRCYRIPPGVFRDGRYFPFGAAFGQCCSPCRRT